MNSVLISHVLFISIVLSETIEILTLLLFILKYVGECIKCYVFV